MIISQKLAEEFKLKQEHSDNIISLIDEGCTIPFIARYRKEMHGACDDQVLREFSERLQYLRDLTARKEAVQKAIESQEKWTDELSEALDKALTMTEVEDIYRPYKKKKKTRASVAIEKGLSELADIMLSGLTEGNLEEIAAPFIDEEKGVKNADEAYLGAKDIIAERISDDAELRKTLRELLYGMGDIVTTIDKEKEGHETYDMYADYKEKLSAIPGHRVLAINRGEKEDFLKVSLSIDTETAIDKMTTVYGRVGSIFNDMLIEAVRDSYQRLIFPSIEREVRTELTTNAQEGAIKLFERNLRPLLMQPPLKDSVILGLDPAYRTGCKIAVIDKSGNVLDHTVIYPTPPQSKIEEATRTLKAMIAKHKVDAIAIGNGTASKEAEKFVADLIKVCDRPVSYMVVNEAGASVYSASKLGAEEFPELTVEYRSAISIARRLQDPLAELIKIDVKSIGVGQYQHDMPEKRLTEVLEGVVESCVNNVGVDLNTASYSLLSYVSGLNKAIAKNIVDYRKNGEFKSRKELLKVAKLGAKAYEQCAGFLRIADGKNILDNTAVHPEAYDATEKLLKSFGYTDEQVKNNELDDLKEKVKAKGLAKVAEEIGVGTPTLEDILTEIAKPGRDIRDSLPKPILRDDLMDISDLKIGMEIMGTVRNVIDFGAFVDIGVHQDGLVHTSEISNDYIKHPSDALTVGDIVKVKVIGVDTARKKISLSIKQASGAKPRTERPQGGDRRNTGNYGGNRANDNRRNNSGNNTDRGNNSFNKNNNRRNDSGGAGKEMSLEEKLAALQNRFNRK